MALPAYALCSLADLKAEVRAGGTGQDPLLERIIGRCSMAVESRALRGRRVVYRGTVESTTSLINAQTWADGAVTLVGAQPAGARTLVATKTDASRSITAGILTVTGTVGGVAGQTEAFDFSSGADEIHGVKFFTNVAGAALAGSAGQDGADKISLGTAVGYVEYHSPGWGTPGLGSASRDYSGFNLAWFPQYISPSARLQILYSIDWPIQNVQEVNEDVGRVYAPATALVDGTDFVVNKRDGELRRLAGTGAAFWQEGPRAERVTLSAGYAGLKNVPQDIQDFTLRLGALTWREIMRQQQGVTLNVDQTGRTDVMSRFASQGLTEAMCEELAEHRLHRYAPIPERDV